MSGNRGDNTATKANSGNTADVAASLTTVPQQSTQPFIPPTTTVKKSVPIKDILQTPPVDGTRANVMPIIEKPPASTIELPSLLTIPASTAMPPQPEPTIESAVKPAPPSGMASLPPNAENQNTTDSYDEKNMTTDLLDNSDEPDLPPDREEVPADDEENVPSLRSKEVVDESLELSNEKEAKNPTEKESLSPFGKIWNTMCDDILQEYPPLYYALKETVPEYENNIIVIQIYNSVVEDYFCKKKREIVLYLRNNFDATIEDVILEIVTMTPETQKKYILSDRDQREQLLQQNNQLADFLNFLDLKLIE